MFACAPWSFPGFAGFDQQLGLGLKNESMSWFQRGSSPGDGAQLGCGGAMKLPVMGQQPLLCPAGANGADWEACVGAVYPAPATLNHTGLAASLCRGRICSGAGCVLFWREATCGSLHSTPPVCLGEVHPGKVGCWPGFGPWGRYGPSDAICSSAGGRGPSAGRFPCTRRAVLHNTSSNPSLNSQCLDSLGSPHHGKAIWGEFLYREGAAQPQILPDLTVRAVRGEAKVGAQLVKAAFTFSLCQHELMLNRANVPLPEGS